MAKPKLTFLNLLLFFPSLLPISLADDPFTCTQQNPTPSCNSYLYHVSRGFTMDEIAAYYSTNTSRITPIRHGPNQDYLVSVPCTCGNVNGTAAYFYDTMYKVREGDSLVNIADWIYNHQAWKGGSNSNATFSAGNEFPFHLFCGCLSGNNHLQPVVTYTVQQRDTLASIADLLSSSSIGIQQLNARLDKSPGFIDVGWVLFVPMEKKGRAIGKKGMVINKMIAIIVVLAASVALLAAGLVVAVVLMRRKRLRRYRIQKTKTMGKTMTANNNMVALHNQYFQKEGLIIDVPAFESERPLTFSLEEIEEATANFDETRKIGEGGYGRVYLGNLAKKEVAIKKMKSSKSKEFFVELKVLCKVHHINVVELIGYACGDDHLYLVYEYVSNGSLYDHLHDPLLRDAGHQPLSWNARAQIALDAARGIEYIHDHTKAQYVHRDIKTSNILLDDTLRAKVADFGLAKLVERSSAEDCIATRLVGTPGYLPPESVRQLQTTSKTDVFAFGVVLAELITGRRALVRDNQETNGMKSLTSLVHGIFRAEDPESALEAAADGTLKGCCPIDEVYKMAEISAWCLNDEAVNRPEMREIVVLLSQIVTASVAWEASLGGKSQVFSGILNGR